MAKKLFIEGTPDDSNGNLRLGFNQLLSKSRQLSGRMPSIVLGGGKNQCIKKFKAFSNHDKTACLLIDLDNFPVHQDHERETLQLVDYKESVFFMVQEMEAWFLSQPEILSQYYMADLKGKIKGKPTDIENPCEKLTDIIKKHTSKGTYHKVNDGARLLAALDIDKLTADFEDVKKLLEKLL